MEGKVITFLGPDHKVGTTTIARAVAQKIAEVNPDKNVLLIDAEGEYLGMWDDGFLSPSIKQDDIASVIKMARQKENLYAIKSYKYATDAFHPDMAEFFIKTLKENAEMDYIICAAGDVEHSMALGSLFASDAVYIVLTHGPYCEDSIRRFEWMRVLYEKLELKIKGFVINRYDLSSAYSPMYIMERLQIDESKLFKVRRAKKNGECLIFKENPEFSKDIKTLTEDAINIGGNHELLGYSTRQ